MSEPMNKSSNYINSSVNTTQSSIKKIGYKIRKEKKTFLQKYGYILAITAGISVSGAIISILIAVIHCYRAARRATTGALALPIPLLPEDQTPLHAEPEHPVPMLSVQSAGCAGMERLGVPARTSLNTPPDDRGHISRRMRVDTIQARDLLVRDTTLLSDRQIRNNNHLHHYHRVGCGNNSSSYSICNSSNIRVGIDAATIMTAQQQQHAVAAKLKPINNDNHHHQQQIRCPHHVPLPDSEWGQDRDLQIRTRYQQSEITRSYIKPPPNKTVLDVPEQSYNFYSSTTMSSAASAAAATSGLSCNLRPNLTNQHSNNHHNYHLQQQQQQQHQPCTSGNQQQQQSAILSQQQKSKPSVITKLFSRKSSPKSPTALCSSSSISSNSSLSSSASSSSSPSSSSSSPSSSSVSTSSSSSSLCSAQTLPISTAATLTATTCSYGAVAPNLTPTSSSNITSSSSFLTTIGVTSATRNSPSPPLAVQVPVAATCSTGMLQQQQFHLQQQQQQQQLLLVDSTNSSNLSSSSLHLLKSSSCNLSPTCSTSPCSSPLSTAAVAAASDTHLATSIDCCYAQATSIQRSHSSSHTASTSPSSQQQQSIDNCGNSNSSSSTSISSSNSMSSSRNYQHHI